MTPTYCLLNVSTVNDCTGPDMALIEVDQALVDQLHNYSKAVEAMAIKPMQVEFYFPCAQFFQLGDVGYMEDEEFSEIYDQMCQSGENTLIVQDLNKDFVEKVQVASNDHRYDLLTVVISGNRPFEYEFSGYLRGSDISFVSRTVTLDALKGA